MSYREHSGRKLRVALVSIHFPPLRTSAALQMSDLAREFVHQGCEVFLITPTEGLTSPCSIEIENGLNILRLNCNKLITSNLLRRTISEITLPFLMIMGLKKSSLHIVKFDLLVWYSPTIFFGPLISYIKNRSNCKTYLILRDIFPEWARDLGLINRGFIYYFFKLVANFQYAVADTIGVQTISNINYFQNWIKLIGKKIEVLNNWITPVAEIGCSIQIKNTTLVGRKIFVYIGNMGVAQDVKFIIDLAYQLMHRNDIGFLFVGRGSELEELKYKVSENSISNTLFFDEIGSSEIPGLLNQCHVGLLALDTRHRSHNIPGKFLNYLSAGLPVLARVNANTDIVNLIEKNNVGLVYCGHSMNEFQRIAEEIIDNAGKYSQMVVNGRLLVRSMFSTVSAVTQILGSFEFNNQKIKF